MLTEAADILPRGVVGAVFDLSRKDAEDQPNDEGKGRVGQIACNPVYPVREGGTRFQETKDRLQHLVGGQVAYEDEDQNDCGYDQADLEEAPDQNTDDETDDQRNDDRDNEGRREAGRKNRYHGRAFRSHVL